MHYFNLSLLFFLKRRSLFLHESKTRKILFSDKNDLEPLIRSSFSFSRHELAFSDLPAGGFEHFDLVIPLTIRDLLYLDAHRDVIAGSPLPIPDGAVIALCDDKNLLNQRLAASRFSSLIPAQGTRAYPYILKKRIDEWGKNCHRVFRREDETALKKKLTDPEYFTEELISGNTEYATHILIKENKLLFALNIKYVFLGDNPIKGQDQPFYTRVCRASFLDEFLAVLEFIHFEGLCCVNYKIKSGRPMIFEINPRFGSSLHPYSFLLVDALVKN